jgi:hypothetical protein
MKYYNKAALKYFLEVINKTWKDNKDIIIIINENKNENENIIIR